MKLAEVRRRALRLLSKLWLPVNERRVVQTRINGYDLLLLANEDVGRDIYFVRRYEYVESQYLERHIPTDAVCIDVGANVGYFSLLMARNAPNGYVYAFEPLPLNVHLLRASAELNGFSNIEVIDCAVASEEGEVEFSQSSDGAYSSIRNTERKPIEAKMKVRATTLDTFVSERSIRRIDVLKIDVEGAEGLVLEGAKHLFCQPALRPKVVLMELVTRNLDAFGVSPLSLIETMIGFGYEAFFVDYKSDLIPFSEQCLNTYYNVLFLQKDRTERHVPTEALR